MIGEGKMVRRIKSPKVIEDNLVKIRKLISDKESDGINNARDRFVIKDLYYKEDSLEKDLQLSNEYYKRLKPVKEEECHQ